MQDMVKTIVLNSAKTKIRMIDSLEKSEKWKQKKKTNETNRLESKQQAWKIIRLYLLTRVPINNWYIVQKQALPCAFRVMKNRKAFETRQMKFKAFW